MFKAAYGNEEREVDVVQVSGNLNGIHIYIDKYYTGSVANVFGKWVLHWVQPTERSVHQELYVADDSDAIWDRLRDAGWIEWI